MWVQKTAICAIESASRLCTLRARGRTTVTSAKCGMAPDVMAIVGEREHTPLQVASPFQLEEKNAIIDHKLPFSRSTAVERRLYRLN